MSLPDLKTVSVGRSTGSIYGTEDGEALLYIVVLRLLATRYALDVQTHDFVASVCDCSIVHLRPPADLCRSRWDGPLSHIQRDPHRMRDYEEVRPRIATQRSMHDLCRIASNHKSDSPCPGFTSIKAAKRSATFIVFDGIRYVVLVVQLSVLAAATASEKTPCRWIVEYL